MKKAVPSVTKQAALEVRTATFWGVPMGSKGVTEILFRVKSDPAEVKEEEVV